MSKVPFQGALAWFGGLALAASVSGCGMGDELLEQADPLAVPSTVTYSQHIKPRMDHYCVSCHRPGGPLGTAGGWNFSSYALVKASFASIEAVSFIERRMPPGAARRMDGRDRAIFSRWKSGGFREQP